MIQPYPDFDPYHRWLGIPPEEQPADYYRLLGVRPFESDPDVIDMAADRQMRHLRSLAGGPRGPLTQRLLAEVSAARLVLLDRTSRAAYDQRLRGQAAPEIATAGPRTWPVSRRRRRTGWRAVVLAAAVLAGCPTALGLAYLALGRLPAVLPQSQAPQDARQPEPERPSVPDREDPPRKTPVAEPTPEIRQPNIPDREEPKQQVVEPPQQPEEGPSIDLRAGLAVVAAEGGDGWHPLKAGEPYGQDKRYVWQDPPAELVGMRYLRGAQSPRLKFRVLTPGRVLLVATTRWRGGGGGGPWQDECVGPKELEAAGWRQAASVESLDSVTGNAMGWVVFERMCSAGEEFSVRTEKYAAPTVFAR